MSPLLERLSGHPNQVFSREKQWFQLSQVLLSCTYHSDIVLLCQSLIPPSCKTIIVTVNIKTVNWSKYENCDFETTIRTHLL
jgi:hypothetical protein